MQAGESGELHETHAITLLEGIDPFYPTGVDPELASAIRRWKEAKIEYHKGMIAEPSYQTDVLERRKAKIAAFKEAETDVKAVINKLANKYGVSPD